MTIFVSQIGCNHAKNLFSALVALVSVQVSAQEVYTMGYEKANIEVLDGRFFPPFNFPARMLFVVFMM
ncbi:MAG: hypothetical protein HWD58_04440 [Bacteroidota bacterium]|nr:MAG: hypothetical protein HWD58_04440 [Bacteroidota bacterium]